MRTFKSYKNALELINISRFDNVVWLRDGCWPQRSLLDTYVPRSEPSSPQIMVYHPGPLACSYDGIVARGEDPFEPFNAAQITYHAATHGPYGWAPIDDKVLKFYNQGARLVDFVAEVSRDPEFGLPAHNRSALERWLDELRDNTRPDWVVFDHGEPGEWVRPRDGSNPWFATSEPNPVLWAYRNYKIMLDIAHAKLPDVKLCVNCMPAGLWRPSGEGRYDRSTAAMRDTLDYWLRRPIEGISLEWPDPSDDYMGFARSWLDAGRSLFLWLSKQLPTTFAKWTEFAGGYPETCYVNVLP